MTRLTDFGAVSPDPEAMAQQLCLIACLYKGRRDLAEQLLGGDGQVLIWEQLEYSYPPSWALIRSGTRRYFMVLAGTTDIAHWAVHATGLRGTPPGIVGGTVNYAWFRVWEAYMRDRVRAELDRDGGPLELNYSGHSYGGALAHIAAVYDREHYPGVPVKVMTFAQPKTFLGGQESRQPPHLFRVRSYYDAVPYTPPERKYMMVLQFIPFLGWTTAVMKWQHYGIDYWLGPGGRMGVGEEPPDPLPTGVSTGFVTEHYTRNYWGRLLALHDREGGSAEMGAALALTDLALSGPDGQVMAPDLSPYIIGPGGEEVEIPYHGLVPEPTGGTTMADQFPTPITGGRVMHALLFFNCADGGWHEGFHLHHNNVGDPYIAVAQWAQNYIDARMKVLSEQARIDYLRISDISIRGDSFVRVKPDLGMGQGLWTGLAGSPNDGWQLTCEDSTRTCKSNRQLRGWPDAGLRNFMLIGHRVRPTATKIAAFTTVVRNLLTTSLPVPGHGTITPVIRSLSKDPAAGTQWQISAFDTDDAGRLRVQLVPSANVIDPGEVLYVTHKRTLGVTGVNGAHTVYASDFTAPQPVITFLSRPPVDITELDGQTGVLARRVVQSVPISFVDWTRASYRQTGRPMSGSHGRRRGR